MRPPCKTVAIVGGGIAGLIASKSLLEEGIRPVCFEKSNGIGGTWRYHEDDTYGVPSVMKTTILNHSKEFFRSDYVFPKETPNYLRQSDFFDFIKREADSYDYTKYVRCNREVILVEKTIDYEETGRWQVHVKNTIDGNVNKDIFDGVLICVGQFSYPKIIKYPGMENFVGQIIHTHSLKKMDHFSGNRIVVVGTGCSALDAAVGASTSAKQVYLSVRTPSWIVPRLAPTNLPLDYVLIRRYCYIIQKILPLRWSSWLLEKYICDVRFDHKLNGINPKYPLLARDPIFNDSLPFKLLTKAVILKDNIKYFTEHGVVFENEIDETKTDVVIMGTGYDWNFDFLEEGTVRNDNGRFNLYKCMYPVHLKHPTLAIIGFVLPLGPGFPIGELQTRWAAHLLANPNSNLPDETIMLRKIENKFIENCKRYSPCEKISLKTDFGPYCDEIAKELGVYPNFWNMAFTDPLLFLSCIFGPLTPYQYRLTGPGNWTGARDAILTAYDRVLAALSPVNLKSKNQTRLRVYVLTNLLIPLMLACLLMWNDSTSRFYTAAILIPYYLLSSKFVSKYLLTLLIIPFFYRDWHGIIALHLLFIGIFMYFNCAHILLANVNFWT